MEAAGCKGAAAGADVALKLGVAGAAAAALAGLTDWHSTDGPARRVGVVHGLLNLTATTLYALSWCERNRKNRATGRALSFTGFAIATVAAWLGGNLVYGKQIGVNHTAAVPMPEDWVAVAKESDLEEGKPRRAIAGEVRVLLVKREGRTNAIAEVCSHLAGPLAEGKVVDGAIECPWHSSRFCLETGAVIDGPATHPQPKFEVRVTNGVVEVRSHSQE
jgi:nitrite reductase/ring-hydroxylating ferredoxin subunit